MARVNVEQVAFADPRFARLGWLIGGRELSVLNAQRLGLGHMAAIWNDCQERGSKTLDTEDIDITVGVVGASGFVVSSGLGVPCSSGGKIRIKGTKGRIEWLANRRKDGSKGGRPKKPYGLEQQNHGGLPKNNPPAPAPAPAPAKEEKKSKTTSSPKKSAQELVEEFRIEDKHREWAKANTPSVPIDEELEAWKDRERANGYTTGKAPGIPVKDPQSAFYTAMRNAEKWGAYRGQQQQRSFVRNEGSN